MVVVCKRCGKCCIIFNGKEWVNCPFLKKDKTCSIYHRRLNRYLGYGFFCIERKNLQWDIPGCPYNSGKPVHPKYR